jgi:hypothetical protein
MQIKAYSKRRGTSGLVVFTDAAVGAKLLEAITAGLYDGNLNCLREYVQNSIDSSAKRVDLSFENGRTNLIIQDDGQGMDEGELREALEIGKSKKTGAAIGWRGIGIWSGIPTCRRIVIITKKQNSPKLRVEIDADKLRQKYNENVPATKVLTEVTGEIEKVELGSDESIATTQYTMIRLEEILPNQRTIFVDKDIKAYLARNLPVPFNIEKFSYGNEINKKLQENGVSTNEINTYFEKEQVFRPPDVDNLFFAKIFDKKFIVKGQVVAFGWFLSSKDNKKLKQPNRGIYFKKKGVTIGDETLVSKQSKVGYSQWQYGEIHILAESLRENASRNNFEANNDILEPFYDQVGEFVRQLQLMNHYQSDNTATGSIERLKKQVDVEEPKPLREKIVHVKKKLRQNRSFPSDPALLPMKEVIDQIATENRKAVKDIEEEIEEKAKEQIVDPLKEKTDRFNDFIKTTHPILRKHLEKMTKKGKLQLNIDAMEPVRTLLQQKTGLNLDSINELSKRAYDWKAVQKGDNGPILVLSRDYKDRDFGVMINSLHDLFVNGCKHELGKDSFRFFESMTEEEKMQTITEFHMTQNLLLRLIKKSKLSKPKGSPIA